jgi:flagellar basal-body rod protein FlgC
MAIGRLFSATDIASSGLSAERMRMEIAAKNIANAQSTRSEDGGPYRRQQVVFSTALERAMGNSGTADGLQGVQVAEVVDDPSEMPKVYLPGHPDADSDGYVTYPNVKMAQELVEMMTASRAYEANLKSLQVFRSMMEQSLSLLKVS